MSARHGKKYRQAAETIEEGKFYPPAEAMSLVRQTATTNFDSSIEAHVRLGIDPRHADQVVRSTVTLPHGTGKTRRIAVFATGEKLREAIEAGDRSLQLNPTDDAVRNYVGFNHLLLGELDVAQPLCATAKPSWAGRLCLAVLYDKLHRRPEAEAQLAARLERIREGRGGEPR